MIIKLSHFYSKERMITPRKARCVICNSVALSSIFLDSFHYQRSGTDSFYCGCGDRKRSYQSEGSRGNWDRQELEKEYSDGVINLYPTGSEHVIKLLPMGKKEETSKKSYYLLNFTNV